MAGEAVGDMFIERVRSGGGWLEVTDDDLVVHTGAG
jgi:hypothetical protein